MSAGPPPQYPSYPGDGGQSGFPYGPRADQRQATTALVLGILGLVICSVLAPFAWAIGHRSMQEIDASGGALGGRGKAQAGYIMGIIGTVLLALAVVVVIVVLIAAASGTSTSGQG
jgi:uncharacterized membrane protein YjgN (DUF898 family)